MTGWEIAQRIREIDPAFPVIYVTGAAASPVVVVRERYEGGWLASTGQ